MKKSKFIALAVTGALLIGGISVLAVEIKNGPKRDFPKKAEFTQEQKAQCIENLKERLSEKLESGKITKEQYDERLSKIENGEFGFGRHSNGKGNRFGQRKELTEEQKAQFIQNLKDRLSKELENGKITKEQYDEKLSKIESGEFGFGRHSNGKGNRFGHRKELTEEQKAQFIQNLKDRLSKELENGKITKEQYDEKLSKIESGDFGFNHNPKHKGKGFGRRHKPALKSQTEKIETAQ